MFNFNNNDFLGRLAQYAEFKKNILATGRNPYDILNDEIKKRGITKEQLKQLADLAKSFNSIVNR